VDQRVTRLIATACSPPQNRPFPQLNLHRPASTAITGGHVQKGFTGRAQNSPHPLTPQRERASGKALTFTRWDEKAGLRGMRYAPNVRRARGTMKRRPAMKKV